MANQTRPVICAGGGHIGHVYPHETVPPGWFVVLPYGGTLPVDEPVEVRVCSERCMVIWAQARVTARSNLLLAEVDGSRVRTT